MISLKLIIFKTTVLNFYDLHLIEHKANFKNKFIQFEDKSPFSPHKYVLDNAIVIPMFYEITYFPEHKSRQRALSWNSIGGLSIWT